MWCMEADALAVDIIFLACQRKLTAEGFGAIPVKDQPTYEELEGYTQRTQNEPNIPWSDRYNELCMWMADYENKKRKKDRDDADDGDLSDMRTAVNNGAFNFQR